MRVRRPRVLLALGLLLLSAFLAVAWVRPATHAADTAAARVLSASQTAMTRAQRLDRALLLDGESRLVALQRLRSSAVDPKAKHALEALLACVESHCGDKESMALALKGELANSVGLARQHLSERIERRNLSMSMLLGILALGAIAMIGVYLRPQRHPPSVAPLDDADSRAIEATLRTRLEQLYDARKRGRENARFAAFGEVAAGLSHGLKTPLACVRAATQVAQAKLADDHAAQANLDSVIDEVDDLVHQINRFLRTMGGGEPVLEELESEAVVTRLDERYCNGIENKRVGWMALVDDGVPTTNGETELVEMALRNLIDNAFQASPAGTQVRLHVRSCRAPARVGIDADAPPESLLDRRWLEFAVLDQGSGIQVLAANRESVESTRAGGSGLGIAIARRIAARLGGALELAQRGDSDGTRASIILPPYCRTKIPEENS